MQRLPAAKQLLQRYLAQAVDRLQALLPRWQQLGALVPDSGQAHVMSSDC
jgi:hypothetical protein